VKANQRRDNKMKRRAGRKTKQGATDRRVSGVEPLDTADFERIDHAALVTGPNDSVGLLFLALSAVYNDLKGFVRSSPESCVNA
jgi:hypothetical protein